MSKIRVLIVDDSVVIRRLLKTVISGDSDFEVVGMATNGREGVQMAMELRPDAITLDVEMPELDGIGTLRELQRNRVKSPVVMFSTLTESGAATTVEALSLGASDCVAKPSNTGSFDTAIERVRGELLPKLKAMCAPAQPRAGATSAPADRSTPVAGQFAVLAIGSSTGGPAALTTVFESLPADFPLPIVITQHMPKLFTKQLAERLDQRSALKVVEASNGDPLRQGTAYVAPGEFHLTFRRSASGATVKLSSAPPENFCRPAVDVMYRSLSDVFGGHVLAVMLTGMGHDGRDSTRKLRDQGAYVIAQDEQTSVVWGMPGALAEAGLADEILPIDNVAPAIVAAATKRPGGSTRRSRRSGDPTSSASSTSRTATSRTAPSVSDARRGPTKSVPRPAPPTRSSRPTPSTSGTSASSSTTRRSGSPAPKDRSTPSVERPSSRSSWRSDRGTSTPPSRPRPSSRDDGPSTRNRAPRRPS